MRIDSYTPSSMTGSASWSTKRTASPSTVTASVIDNTPSDIDQLAAALGVSTGKLSSLVTSGGSMNVTAGGAARLAGLPLAPDGTPDFDAIRAAGGTVKGAIPPDGLAKMTWVAGDRQTTYVAAEVTMPGGQPTYVKSLNMQMPGGDSAAKDNQEQVRTALHYFQKLPDTYQDALQRLGDGENFWDAAAGGVDLHL